MGDWKMDSNKSVITEGQYMKAGATLTPRPLRLTLILATETHRSFSGSYLSTEFTL